LGFGGGGGGGGGGKPWVLVLVLVLASEGWLSGGAAVAAAGGAELAWSGGGGAEGTGRVEDLTQRALLEEAHGFHGLHGNKFRWWCLCSNWLWWLWIRRSLVTRSWCVGDGVDVWTRWA
jgi:hypothetical protein